MSARRTILSKDLKEERDHRTWEEEGPPLLVDKPISLIMKEKKADASTPASQCCVIQQEPFEDTAARHLERWDNMLLH